MEEVRIDIIESHSDNGVWSNATFTGDIHDDMKRTCKAKNNHMA